MFELDDSRLAIPNVTSPLQIDLSPNNPISHSNNNSRVLRSQTKSLKLRTANSSPSTPPRLTRDLKVQSNRIEKTQPKRPSIQKSTSSSSLSNPSSSTTTIPATEPCQILIPPRLTNTQQNCYLSSILQCLFGIPEIVSYFYHDTYTTDLNASSFFHGELANAFASVIKSAVRSNSKINVVVESFSKRRGVRRGGRVRKDVVVDVGGPDDVRVYPPVDPIPIKNVLEKRYVGFGGSFQQDASEFLFSLLEGLNEDLTLDPTKSERNKIIQLFEGTLATEIYCPICDKIYTDFERFRQLTLTLPNASIEPQRRSQIRRANAFSKYSSVTKTCTLDECFKEFGAVEYTPRQQCGNCMYQKAGGLNFEKEMSPSSLTTASVDGEIASDGDELGSWLDYEETVVCTPPTMVMEKGMMMVGKSELAWKRRRIAELPQILVIHLNRFVWHDFSTAFKIGTVVEFPSGIGGDEYLSIPGDLRWKGEGKEKEVKYGLFAVCSHSGDHAGGHYTAYRKIEDKWCFLDDDRPMQEFEIGEIDDAYTRKNLEKSAFILMYRQLI